jgi:hypothetical protein
MKVLQKRRVKDVLGRVPLMPEMEWFIRRRDKPVGGFRLNDLNDALPEWKAHVSASPLRSRPGKKVFIFGTLRYWVRHTALLAMALSGLGHEVTLGYLPYGSWLKPVSDYDLRLQNLYGKRLFKQVGTLVSVFSLLDVKPNIQLPDKLEKAIGDVSVRDCQYTQQVEEIDFNNPLYSLRTERNLFAASACYGWMQEHNPDVVIVPNGLILEFGAIFEAARFLDIPVVSYEFGEQRERIWLSLNRPVMFQDTAEMWETRKQEPFTDGQLKQVTELFASRRGAGLWKNFSRLWQDIPTEGGASVRAKLGLDDRPVVLLAANVIGDSLTLGRQVFSGNMTEWVKRTLDYFTKREDVQFLLRVHPGERYVDGPSVVDIVRGMLPEPPEHIHIIPADASVNTYDLISIASLGLTYTTTVGMEMAMSGVPAVVVGSTHYRGKGFTFDPVSWDEFFAMLDSALEDSAIVKLSEDQVRAAWHYAYRFYFDYPKLFPWHMRDFWENVERWPLSKMFTEEAQATYGKTFDYLTGQPVDWTNLD